MRSKEYTKTELSRMRAIAKAGKSARDAATILKRPLGGVKYKAMIEGIRFFSVKQPKGVQKRRFA